MVSVTNADPNADPKTLDAFVATFNGATGAATSAVRFGSAGDDWIESVAVDPATGNVLVAGGFSQGITLGADTYTASSPNNSVFLASLGPNP